MIDRTSVARLVFAGLFVALLVAIDQAVKIWAEAVLPMHQRIDLVPMLALFRTYNEGIAFSFLAGTSDRILVVFTVLVVVFVAYLWHKTEKHRRLAQLGFALVVGGAFGNLIDRIVYGHVIDYILVYTQTWSFAVFNLADSFITLGAAAIIVDELLLLRATRKSD